MPDGEELAVMDFTTAILQQTFEGLVQAMLAQKERNTELLQVSRLLPEEYAKEHVSEEMGRDKLIEIFGGAEGEEGGGGCRVDAGQTYFPANETSAEHPEIFKRLGVEFGEGDYVSADTALVDMVPEDIALRDLVVPGDLVPVYFAAEDLAPVDIVHADIASEDIAPVYIAAEDIVSVDIAPEDIASKYIVPPGALPRIKKPTLKRFLISERGAQRLQEAARQKIAKESLEKLQRLVAGGLPEVYVESGRILSKASFRVEREGESRSGTEKVLLRTLNTSSPGVFRMKAGISGEIEVKFKVGRS